MSLKASRSVSFGANPEIGGISVCIEGDSWNDPIVETMLLFQTQVNVESRCSILERLYFRNDDDLSYANESKKRLVDVE